MRLKPQATPLPRVAVRNQEQHCLEDKVAEDKDKAAQDADVATKAEATGALLSSEVWQPFSKATLMVWWRTMLFNVLVKTLTNNNSRRLLKCARRTCHKENPRTPRIWPWLANRTRSSLLCSSRTSLKRSSMKDMATKMIWETLMKNNKGNKTIFWGQHEGCLCYLLVVSMHHPMTQSKIELLINLSAKCITCDCI